MVIVRREMPTQVRMRILTLPVLAGLAGGLAWSAPALAERQENAVAVFAALDKVTARISRLEVRLNETVKFGSLKVTPRVCYSRPPTEPPKTTSFVEVQEEMLDGKEKKLFSGWMFAESPGLNAVEHPVFDVWLTECAEPVRSVAQGRGKANPAQAAPAAEEPARRRVRR
jgi:hypothetical protein